MQREILFRGICKTTKNWIYGYYFKTPLTDEATGSKSEDGWFFLAGKERHCISQNGCVYEVDPETVGQLTGRKDKKRKKIFEGDIVKMYAEDCIHYWDYIGKVTFTDEAFGLMSVDETTFTAFNKMSLYNKTKEVIGNIHDNRLRRVSRGVFISRRRTGRYKRILRKV